MNGVDCLNTETRGSHSGIKGARGRKVPAMAVASQRGTDAALEGLVSRRPPRPLPPLSMQIKAQPQSPHCLILENST